MSGRVLPVVLPDAAEPQDSTTRGFDPYNGGRLNAGGNGSNERVRNLPTDRLTASLQDIRAGLDEVFSSITEVGNFQLNEIKLTLEITAEGGFALVGLAKAGAKGGITLSFSPPKKVQ